MRYRILYLCILFTTITFSVFPQEKQDKAGTWSGEFEVRIGDNFNLSPRGKKKSSSSKALAKIGYSTAKFNFSVTGDLPYKRIMTFVQGIDYKLGEKTSGDSSFYEKDNKQINASINAGWKPNKNNFVSVYYTYNHNKNIHNYLTVSSTIVSEYLKDFSSSLELGDDYYDINKAGGSYKHNFEKEGRSFVSNLDFNISSNTYFSDWTTAELELSQEEFEVNDHQKYRNTPSSNTNHAVFNACYTDPKFANINNLDLEFSLSMDYTDLHEHHSASTLISGVWKDSLSARENFRYRTYTIDPTISLRYHFNKTEISFSYTPEAYNYILDSDGRKGDITRGNISHNISFFTNFKLGIAHTLSVSLKRKESRPSYLQICWFPRGSNFYSNEIEKGNPDLLNSVYTYTNIGYTFNHKSLTAHLGVDLNIDPRKIESTYYYDTYNDKEYRVNTWINGGRSQEVKINGEFTLKIKKLMLNLGGTLTFYRGYNLSGDLTKSSDYNIHIKGEYLYRTWKFNFDMAYQSEIIRSYSSITVIPTLNCVVTKTFGKHFTAYFECAQLLDRAITIRQVSDDNSEVRITQNINNNRLFTLGVNYKF